MSSSQAERVSTFVLGQLAGQIPILARSPYARRQIPGAEAFGVKASLFATQSPHVAKKNPPVRTSEAVREHDPKIDSCPTPEGGQPAKLHLPKIHIFVTLGDEKREGSKEERMEVALLVPAAATATARLRPNCRRRSSYD